MSKYKLLLLLASVSLAFSGPLAAKPWEDDSGKGHHGKHHKKHKHWKESRHHEQGPPPWAPAHGYRNKHHQDQDEYERDARYYREAPTTNITLEVPVYSAPRYQAEPQYREPEPRYREPERDFQENSATIGITAGTCNREKVGAVMGGLIGGVIANKTSSGKNKGLKTLVGALFGAVIGKEVGKNMDNEDAACTHQALERARDGQAISWKNPDSGEQYQVTPYKTYQRDDGRYCRKYKAVIGDKDYRETACRSEQGEWQRQ